MGQRRLIVVLLANLALACSAPAPRTAQDVRLDSPYGLAYHAEPLDDGQIKVVASDYAGIELGLCTDIKGAVGNAYCTVSHTKPSPAAAPRLDQLSKGIFGQYTRLKSFDSSSSVDTVAGEARGTFTSAEYEVIYEWSRFKAQSIESTELSPDKPAIASVDVGIAIRLVMEVTIDSASGSVSTNLGLGKLAAALEERRAQASVRFAVFGVSSQVAPDRLIRIDSAADLFDTLEIFRKKAEVLAVALEENCGAVPPQKCGLQPEILAYYVRGNGIGALLRKHRIAKQRCVDAKSLADKLAALPKITNVQGVQQTKAAKDAQVYCRLTDELEAQATVDAKEPGPPAKKDAVGKSH